MQYGGRPAPDKAEQTAGRHRAEELCGNVAGDVVGVDLALGPESQGDGRVEVSAATPAERTEGDEAAGTGEQQARHE